MSARRLVQGFALALLPMLVALAPLRMTLGWSDAAEAGLSARTVEGTVWSGAASGAAFQGAELGDVRLGLQPLPLALGQVWLAGEVAGPAIDLRGRLRLADHGLHLAGVSGAAPAEALVPGLPFQARLAAEDLTVRFVAGRCHTAKGRLALDRLQFAGGAPLGGRLTLHAQPQCRDGLLVAPFAGEAEGMRIEADLQLDAAGRYQLETRLRAADPGFAALAGFAGFEQGLDGLRRRDAGRLGLSPRDEPHAPPIGP